MGDSVRVLCNTCNTATWHDVVHEHETEFPEYEDDQLMYVEYLRSRVLVCRGCETPTYEEAESMDHQENAQEKVIWECRLYPERKAGKLRKKVFAQLPTKLDRVYGETIGAYNAGLGHLCAVGLRSLIEGICHQQGVPLTSPDGKFIRLVDKIDGLKGGLPHALVDNLHAFRFMGNFAAHELAAPHRDDLKLAIAIIEDLMNFLYNLDYQASRLARKHIPGDKTRKQNPGSAGGSER